MNAFAGFWVDGAVRKPEQRHRDRNNWIVANWKDTGNDFDICQPNFDDWDKVYWLDTTPRESLTPEELYSILSLIWGGCGQLCKSGNDSWCIDEIANGMKVDWGNLTQYPPPVEPQWVRITRENVGQYLFRLCRCRDSESESWQDGHIVGWDMEDEDCLVDGDFDPVERVLKFSFVEVQV